MDHGYNLAHTLGGRPDNWCSKSGNDIEMVFVLVYRSKDA